MQCISATNTIARIRHTYHGLLTWSSPLMTELEYWRKVSSSAVKTHWAKWLLNQAWSDSQWLTLRDIPCERSSTVATCSEEGKQKSSVPSCATVQCRWGIPASNTGSTWACQNCLYTCHCTTLAWIRTCQWAIVCNCIRPGLRLQGPVIIALPHHVFAFRTSKFRSTSLPGSSHYFFIRPSVNKHT